MTQLDCQIQMAQMVGSLLREQCHNIRYVRATNSRTPATDTLGIDTVSIPGRIHIPQCLSFSQALTQTWMMINTKFHVSSKHILWTWSSPECLGKDQYHLIWV